MTRRYQAVRSKLESVEEGRLQMACLRREIRYLEDRCTGTIQSYAERSGGSGSVHPELWDRLADKKASLMEQEREQQLREEEVALWISRLPNARWRLVLQCKYLQGMDLLDIMEEMGRAAGYPFTINQVYRYHSKALEALEKLQGERTLMS